MILTAPARINLVDTFDLVELEIHELDLKDFWLTS